MSYIIIHKFARVFGCTYESAHVLSLVAVTLTSVYVLFGGFKGGIFSEFLQNGRALLGGFCHQLRLLRSV